jgi:hypothetical protein
LRQRTHARAHALVGWLSGRLDLSVRPCGRARGVAGMGVVYQPAMSRIPWNRRSHSLPNPRVQSGLSRGSFMSAVYSISFPLTGWMTAFARCCRDQWLFPRAMTMWDVSIPQKSSWYKLRGESPCERVGTSEVRGGVS